MHKDGYYEVRIVSRRGDTEETVASRFFEDAVDALEECGDMESWGLDSLRRFGVGEDLYVRVVDGDSVLADSRFGTGVEDAAGSGKPVAAFMKEVVYMGGDGEVIKEFEPIPYPPEAWGEAVARSADPDATLRFIGVTEEEAEGNYVVVHSFKVFFDGTIEDVSELVIDYRGPVAVRRRCERINELAGRDVAFVEDTWVNEVLGRRAFLRVVVGGRDVGRVAACEVADAAGGRPAYMETVERLDLIGAAMRSRRLLNPIREVRTSLGLTREELAGRADVGPGRLAEWEDGFRHAGPRAVERIAEATGEPYGPLLNVVDDIWRLQHTW